MADLVPALMGGSIVIETIFTIPGMGRMTWEAVLAHAYPVVMAVFTMSAFLTLAGILIADVLYTFVDPRISHARRNA
jgi:peptide/nickel transport system permease protein